MSPVLQFALYLAAVACFVLAAFGYPRHDDFIFLGWLGAAFLATIGMVAAVQAI